MQKRSQWMKKYKSWFLWAGIGLFLIFILTFLLVGEYAFHWMWAGFNKTLWDWLQLIILPATLTIASLLFARSERHSTQRAEERKAEIERQESEQRTRSEQQMAQLRAIAERSFAQMRLETEMRQREEYQRESLLQSYLDRMENALIARRLRKSAPDAEVRKVVRARTLTVLRRLDPERKADVLWFLYESNLLDYGSKDIRRIVDVSDADWSHIRLDGSQLRHIDLSDVNLFHAHMQEVDLVGAKLKDATLCQANLRGANLRGANLSNADLPLSDLTGADLTGAILQGADLSRTRLIQATLRNSNLLNANLERADISQADLEAAHYDEEQLKTVYGRWSAKY